MRADLARSFPLQSRPTRHQLRALLPFPNVIKSACETTVKQSKHSFVSQKPIEFDMPSSLASVMALLQRRLSSMKIRDEAAENANLLDLRIVDSFVSSLQRFDRQDVFEYEETEELEDSNYDDEDAVPVFEDFCDERIDAVMYIPYEYVCNVLDWIDEHPNRGEASLKQRWKLVRNRSYIPRFRKYRDQMGTNRERWLKVAQHCKEMFDTARALGHTVHDETLRSWALQKATQLQVEGFTASSGWIHNFKKTYRITSRRITKFVTYNQAKDVEAIENEGVELILDFNDNVKLHFDPQEVFNTDQSGFNYIAHSNRTLSHRGEKATVASYNALGPLTHSYTIQPLLNMNGNLVGKLWVNLQEVTGSFGPRVLANLPQFSNLYVTCTKSGKLSKDLVREWAVKVFSEALKKLHSERCVLYLDSWGGHRESQLYGIAGKEVIVKVFPKGSTGFMQPLDLYCFRQWKTFAKRVTEQCMMQGFRVDQRNDILRLQSLIYNQFQHSDFRTMWRCGWRLGGFEVPEVEFPNINEMLFKVRDACASSGCNRCPFIRCVYCKAVLCVDCFFMKYHFHEG